MASAGPRGHAPLLPDVVDAVFEPGVIVALISHVGTSQ